ncbi:hypothetical protein [Chryseobacterium limigenitum]|uniref:GDSL-like Lipase/Acylhydrolase family protein n=1 Tax=Chryseobacterium limigenitum TaxID=1612149 RepID=A0A1K2IDH4_9FLAO|nr:hypothetical protein [Chryseobacterium limigenitum]SFZ90310.1 hypothetical protein SAMN05216324_101304 [Chryseobacterium limigenitum]
MKKFIKNIALFVFPVLVILMTMEPFLRKIPNEYSVKDNYLKKNSNTIDVLYLGSSHIYFGLNPEFSKYKAYNASYISQSINLDWLILNKYKENWKNLKFIVLPADYISMYSTLNTAKDEWRIKNYNLYYGFGIGINPVNYLEIFQGKFQDHVKKINEFYFEKKQAEIVSNNVGFGISYKFPSHNDIAKTSIETIKRHSVDIDNRVYHNNFKENLIAIDNIVDFAVKRKIKVIFISTPVSKEYFKGSNNLQLKKSLEVFKNLAKEKPVTCFYVDYMQNKEFTDDDLYDGDHLNDRGAQKLTHLLDSEITKLSQ